MKKKIIVSIAMLGLCLSAMAQSEGFKYGARFGIGQAHFSDSSFPIQEGRIALNFGLTTTKQFNKFLLYRPMLFLQAKERDTLGMIQCQMY
jgi:hypothetical protein